MAFLKIELLENIFCQIKNEDLLCICANVCINWKNIILNNKYMPFRTLYHRFLQAPNIVFWSPLLLKNKHHHLLKPYEIFEFLCEEYNIQNLDKCLKGLLRMTRSQSFIFIDENMKEILKKHPCYYNSQQILTNSNYDSQNLLNIIIMMSAFSRDVSEIQYLMYLLIREPFLLFLPLSKIIDLFYKLTGIFHFTYYKIKTKVVHYYKIHSALFLAENKICYHPENLTCEQMRIINHFPQLKEIIKIECAIGVNVTYILSKLFEKHKNVKFLLIVGNLYKQPHFNLTSSTFTLYNNVIFFSFNDDILSKINDEFYNIIVIDFFIDIVTPFKELIHYLSEKNINIKKYIVYRIEQSTKNQDLCYCANNFINKNYPPQIIPVGLSPIIKKIYLSPGEKIRILLNDFYNLYFFCFLEIRYQNTNITLIMNKKELDDHLNEITNNSIASYRIGNNNGSGPLDYVKWVNKQKIININEYNYNDDDDDNSLSISLMNDIFKTNCNFNCVWIPILSEMSNYNKYNLIAYIKDILYNFGEESYLLVNIIKNNTKCIGCNKNMENEIIGFKTRSISGFSFYENNFNFIKCCKCCPIEASFFNI